MSLDLKRNSIMKAPLSGLAFVTFTLTFTANVFAKNIAEDYFELELEDNFAKSRVHIGLLIGLNRRSYKRFIAKFFHVIYQKMWVYVDMVLF